MSMPKGMVVTGDRFRQLGAIPDWLVVLVLDLRGPGVGFQRLGGSSGSETLLKR